MYVDCCLASLPHESDKVGNMEIAVVYDSMYEMELYHLYDGSLSTLLIAFTSLQYNDMDAHACLIFVLLVLDIRRCI